MSTASPVQRNAATLHARFPRVLWCRCWVRRAPDRPVRWRQNDCDPRGLGAAADAYNRYLGSLRSAKLLLAGPPKLGGRRRPYQGRCCLEGGKFRFQASIRNHRGPYTAMQAVAVCGW